MENNILLISLSINLIQAIMPMYGLLIDGKFKQREEKRKLKIDRHNRQIEVYSNLLTSGTKYLDKKDYQSFQLFSEACNDAYLISNNEVRENLDTVIKEISYYTLGPNAGREYLAHEFSILDELRVVLFNNLEQLYDN